MSHCKEFGKDKIVFVSKEDHEKPSTVVLAEIDDSSPGLILPNGDINWSCPCLGGMASGPCGVQFREAFSCFHYSQADPKGSDCIEKFNQMQECMVQYPSLYPLNKDDDDEDDVGQVFNQELDKKEDSKTIENSDKNITKDKDSNK